MDTGNNLVDPYKKRPIILVNYEKIKKYITNKKELLVPYNSINNNGLLRCIKVLKIEIDNHLLEKFAGDGILVSTSFGSTAYNLSFGGSIVYNVFHSIQLTPIAPLNNKSYRNIINSVVLPQNKVIKISPVKTKDLLISVDGENNIYTDVLYVQTVIQNKIIKCLRNKEYNFIDKINEKFIK